MANREFSAVNATTERPQPCKQILAPRDRDSIYYSKERWRIIPQRLGPMSIQYLVIDAHHIEIEHCRTACLAEGFRRMPPIVRCAAGPKRW